MIHVVGYPAVYAYLFFKKFREPLAALRDQELADHHIEKLSEIGGLDEAELDQLKKQQMEKHERIDETILPGYIKKLTAGYEYRTYWFELFEMIRKVLLVGVPATFPDRGGNLQLVWGLLVCFISAGMYMMYAPYVEDGDDRLAQLAQLQVFVTLAASIGLRATPPEPILTSLCNILLVLVPVVGLLDPIYKETMDCYEKSKYVKESVQDKKVMLTKAMNKQMKVSETAKV